MARRDWGSLTKEPPLSTLDDTILAIRPGMSYGRLLRYARSHTLDVAPGLLRKRFLLVDDDETIIYDRFLQLVNELGIASAVIRKIMYFVWAYRDDRVRRFICERIANKRGKWQAKQILNKQNADFFEEWLVPGSAQKARSNIEFFLTKTGIFDPVRRTINLNFDDGWLSEAALVAAQHEDGVNNRRTLLDDPRNYLISKGWIGLVNASKEELLDATLVESSDPSPLEDDSISLTSAPMAESQTWHRQPPKHSNRGSTTVHVDLVVKERASKAHYMLEKLTADAARSANRKPRFNDHIDMFFDTPMGTVLVEIKSANGRNFHSQVRKGVSQLFEYRFVYREIVGDRPTLLLVMEIEPRRSKSWLVEYLDSLGITLAWKHPESFTLVTNLSIPQTLEGIVHSVNN